MVEVLMNGRDDVASYTFRERVFLGLEPRWSSVEKFGENPDIDTDDGFATIWDGGGTYVPPTQPRIHDIASTSASDTGTVLSSGTATGGGLTSIIDTGATFITDTVAQGDVVLNDSNCEIAVITAVTSETELTFALTIRNPSTGVTGTAIEAGDAYRVVTNASTGASIYFVQGLDASILITGEFVVLNGTSNVATANSYYRQWRARAFGANTTGIVGVVTSTAQTDGTVSSQIIDGNNQTLMAVYTIPIDKVGYLEGWHCATSKANNMAGTCRLRIGTMGGLTYIQDVQALSSDGTSSFNVRYEQPLLLSGGLDIFVESDTTSNNAGISAGFSLLLKDA